ncbi:hypothetical protein [Hyphomicrobium sp.]|jgi:hypothetical protein|uniref:hypothetical protein n=1 Tax=Hyphomicrobium sp. TaxID=82 RepID=UPI003562C495
MSKMEHLNLEDIEEAQICVHQRQLLFRVRQFLLEHSAGEELLEAVDQAMEDNEQWGVPEVEEAILDGRIKGGSA